MVTKAQSRILRAVAALALLAFVVQPKVSSGGFPMGWRLFWSNYDNGNGVGAWTGLYPDYKLLAAEYVALAIAAVCLYLAAGERRGE